MKSFKHIFKLIPGILFLFIVGLISKYIGGLILCVSYLIIAIALGIASANLVKVPKFI